MNFNIKIIKQKSKRRKVVKLKAVSLETLKIVDINSNKRALAIMIDNNIENEKYAGLQNSFISCESYNNELFL